MKVCVAISSHSPAFFTKMTVGTILREVKNHDLNIHVGYHANLSDYTTDLSLFELNKICQLHAVDEIDWAQHNSDIYRYSKMHAKNLENIFKNVRYYDFDYLAILDNDLYIKRDFITNIIEKFPNSDLIGSYFDDKSESHSLIDNWGNPVSFAPKCSVWNMFISRKMFNKIMEDTNVIYPKFIDGVFYDTLSEILKKSEEWGMNKSIIKTEEMSEVIHHFFHSSFNYGIGMNKKPIDGPLEIWSREFPNGISDIIK